jgi:predicted transcriptional regulator
MVEFTLNLPDDVLERLQSEAEERQVPLADLVQTAIEYYLDDDEPTNEEILEDLRQAFRDVRAGRTRPAQEVMDEIRRELGLDADQS